MLYKTLLTLALALSAFAQQYAGEVISGSLPTVPGTEVAYFKIPDPTGDNDNLTLINYYSLGTTGARVNNANIQRAVITIHGLQRDPYNYIKDTLNALAKVSDPNINVDSVAVMAPFFASGSDKNFAYPWTDGLKPNRGSTSNALVWSGSRWSSGANNQYPYSSTNASSFYVLDQIVQYFSDQSLFPNLKQIVLVGHSMGGQMLQRYAAVSTLQTRLPVTYWIGNPNSYLWLSENRPLTTADCPDYDNYREGLAMYEDYPMTYGSDLVAQGREAVFWNYQSKQIAYARAMLDHGDHSTDCRPNTTGADRHERFFFFLNAFQPYCGDPKSSDCDTVDLIPVTHDNGQMFGSPAGLARLFTDNFYGNGSRAYDFGYPRAQVGDDPYPDPEQAGTVNPNVNTNVYAGEKTYQGCWTDQAPVTPHALERLMYDDAINSIDDCTSACSDNGFAVAGLANGTQCWCGHALRRESAVLVVDGSCRVACPGDGAQVCGGVKRLSVFSKGSLVFE